MILELYGESIGDESLPPFVILHGLFGSGSNWRSIARQLSGRYRVICLDLRNHGRSPWGDEMAYFDLAGDVVRYLHGHELENPVILGHSMGGKTAMTILQEFDVVPSDRNATQRADCMIIVAGIKYGAKLIIQNISLSTLCPSVYIRASNPLALFPTSAFFATDERCEFIVEMPALVFSIISFVSIDSDVSVTLFFVLSKPFLIA